MYGAEWEATKAKGGDEIRRRLGRYRGGWVDGLLWGVGEWMTG